jgi:hypothetical protein
MPKTLNKPKERTFKIATGLTRKEALAKAPKPKQDARGFTYDPKTGKGKWV